MKKVKIVKIAAAVLMAVGGCLALFGSDAWADKVYCNTIRVSVAQCATDIYYNFATRGECSSGSSLNADDVKRCVDIMKKENIVTYDSYTGYTESAANSYYEEVAKALLNCRGLMGQSTSTIRSCIAKNTTGYVAPTNPTQNGGGGGDPDSEQGGGNTPQVPTANSLPNKSQTSILPGDWKIVDIIRFVVNIMTGAVVVAGTVGIVFCGYLWMTARDNEAQVAKAKKRMLEVVIGLVAWVLFGVLIQFIMPDTTNVYEDGVVVKSSIIEEKK